MNTAIKQKWISALRSGEYKQDTGALKNTQGFCCLGVLTDLYIKETGRGTWNKEWPFMFEEDEQTESGVTPPPVRIWAEWDATGEGILIALNDGDKSFSKIADYIEENYNGSTNKAEVDSSIT